MMNLYRPLNPHWLCAPIEIEGIEAIQQELAYYQTTLPYRQTTRHNSYYTNVFRNDVLAYTPMLRHWLESKHLLHKFQRLLYTANMTNGSPPHVDTLDPTICSYSINIPLSNTEGTYTAWYAAEEATELQQATRLYQPHQFATIKPQKAYREIHRAESIHPMIVNTTVLHGAVCSNPDRKLVGIRFSPELTYTELQALGIDITKPTI